MPGGGGGARARTTPHTTRRQTGPTAHQLQFGIPFASDIMLR
jgi:hypothetical protein